VALTQEGLTVGQLEAFIEVARLGNVTLAGETLFLTQPGVSARLNRLEQSLGMQLLVRDHRGARLTGAGVAFLPYAERVVNILRDGRAAMEKSLSQSPAPLVIAATSGLSTYVLPKVIKQFLAQVPGAGLEVRIAASEDVWELVLKGQVEFGLGGSLLHPDLDCLPLYEEELVLCCHYRHRLASEHTVDMVELQTEVLCLFTRSQSYSPFLEAMIEEVGTGPQAVLDIDNSHIGRRFLEDVGGIGLLPRIAVQDDLNSGVMHELVIRGLRPMRRPMAVIRQKDRQPTYTGNLLIGMLRDRFRGAAVPPQRPGAS
jgi:DNA-binding transcriptional LysR family regulator